MVIGLKLFSELCNRADLLLLGVDGTIEVLVLLDEGLHTLSTRAIYLIPQRGLAGHHPVLGILTVTIEQLQLKALVKLGTMVDPRPRQNNRQDKHHLPFIL